MSQPPDTPFSSSLEEESFTDSVIRAFKKKPAVVLGLGAMIGALGYGYNRYKTKGYLVSPSLFILQLRVGAQSAVVGVLTIAMTYNMIQTHVLNKKSKSDNASEN